MTTVAEMVIGARAEAWRAVGFDVIDDLTDGGIVQPGGIVQLGGIRLRLVDGDAGVSSWTLADAFDPAVVDIDGLATAHGDAAVVAAGPHPNTVTTIDHVVVYTPDLERTCAAIEAATAAPLKRIREVGSLHQGFHRLGELIVEVVTFPQVTVDRATFWGLALNVTDIDALYERCGDELMSAPKDAVQPGRRIASFRESAALGLPVAVMTPHRR